ncbi:unnamed protein product [Arabidopsis thaliana]|uniref:Uncharacterized protein n=1 Tax=Arabidopsis thaliana TaxID=3702 RepID=A0A5S9XNF0_ARATH|nr:unnamed protein product [Arabidopsis thaliana]
MVDKNLSGSRIRRPGVGIVDRVREFVDQDGGILDNDEVWSRKLYRVRGFVYQVMESSTRTKNSSTRGGIVVIPIMRADISKDPTLVKKITAIVDSIKPRA